MSIQARNVNHPEYTEPLKEEKYLIIKAAILAVLPENGAGTSFDELDNSVRDYLDEQSVDMNLFPKPGSVRWYTKTVQLDLEARGLIERIPKTAPMRLRKI